MNPKFRRELAPARSMNKRPRHRLYVDTTSVVSLQIPRSELAPARSTSKRLNILNQVDATTSNYRVTGDAN